MLALIFDLDDTLVVEEASAEAAFIETGELAQAKYGLDPRDLHATVRKTCRELWYGSPSHPYCKRVGISSWEGLWAEFIGADQNLKALRDWAPTYRFESWRRFKIRVYLLSDRSLFPCGRNFCDREYLANCTENLTIDIDIRLSDSLYYDYFYSLKG